ncbi:hypothetical protein PG993_007015 [Apiospora rasikravindrae]|uniref:Uncharacterized protein n=1 Tax=Apiospora rasikravindrae TaxID=990691 RepID=A0ABR1SW99_9PEZI
MHRPTEIPRSATMDLKEKLAEYQYFKVDTAPELSQQAEAVRSDSPKPESPHPQPMEATKSAIPRPKDDLKHQTNISAWVSRIIGSKQDGPREIQELKEAWLKRSEYAQHYLQKCSFHNATALYESYIVMAEELPYQQDNIVFQSRTQLAVINIMCGQYHDAVSDLETLKEEAQKTRGSNDLSIFDKISYYHAVTLVGLGDFKEAITKLDFLSPSLRAEEDRYLRRNIGDNKRDCCVPITTNPEAKRGASSSKKSRETTVLFELEAACDDFINKLIEYLASISQQPKDTDEVHPALLYALGAWAKNELTRTGTERGRAIQAQLAIFELRRVSPPFQPGHFATQQSGLDLANTLRRGHQIRYRAASPDSISEAETARFLSIPKLMSLRLGSRHPDTLQALLAGFAAFYYINEDFTAEISAELRQQLRDPKVRPRRPVECIQMEEKLGLIHYRLGNTTEAAKISTALAQSLHEGEADELSKVSEGKEIDQRLYLEIVKVVGEALEPLWQGAQEAKQDGRFFDAVDQLRLLCSLPKAVHGEYDEVTEKASFNLTVSLWQEGQRETGQYRSDLQEHTSRRQQQEAVDILRGIVTRMTEEDAVKPRLQEGLEGWEAELALSSAHELSL